MVEPAKEPKRTKTDKTGQNRCRSASCTCANAYDVRNRWHCTNQHKAWCYFKLNSQTIRPNTVPRNSIFCVMQILSYHRNNLEIYETYKKVLVTSHTKYFSVSNFTSPCLINNSINHSFHLLPKSYSNWHPRYNKIKSFVQGSSKKCIAILLTYCFQ